MILSWKEPHPQGSHHFLAGGEYLSLLARSAPDRAARQAARHGVIRTVHVLLDTLAGMVEIVLIYPHRRTP